MPLSFVIFVDAIFAALEDLARHKADDLANASKALIHDDAKGSFEETTWSNVKVGSFIKVRKRNLEEGRGPKTTNLLMQPLPWLTSLAATSQVLNRDVIPADVIILAVKEKTAIAEGRAYVETKSLDGETNLKMRRALKNTLNEIKVDSDVKKIGHGEIVMEVRVD
jgi:magnesium-transporting ATPase (P-type)